MGFFDKPGKGGTLVDVVYNKLTGGNQQSPGKSTLSGSLPASPGRPPTPPQYAGLDPNVVEMIWLSRNELFATLLRQQRLPGITAISDATFWDQMDAMGTQELHTLVQVLRGARNVGIFSSIVYITDVYTHPGSYGIKFMSAGRPPLPEGEWGRDLQFFVAREHPGGEHYEWFRNNSGAGAPGMHIGLAKSSGGDNDLHWDPTNPMQDVGKGTIQIVEYKPVYMPKGQAIYSPAALAVHLGDIGYMGKDVQKGMSTQSDKQLLIHQFKGVPATARRYADMEDGKLSFAVNRPRAEAAISEVRTAASVFAPLYDKFRVLAMQDDTTSAHDFNEAYQIWHAARKRLWEALAALVRHLRDEVPRFVHDLRGYDVGAEWEPKEGHDQQPYADGAERHIVALQHEREQRALNGTIG